VERVWDDLLMIRTSLINLAKALFEWPLVGIGILLYYAGLAPFAIWLRRSSPRVLMFHAVENGESAFIRGLSVNTEPSRFAAQLDFLKKCYDIVPISDYGIKPLPPRALVLTFDDGFRSVYQHAFPLLKAAGVAATCYLSTDVIGNLALIWLNELTWFLHQHPSRTGPLVSTWLGLNRVCSRRELIRRVIASYDIKRIRELLEELRATIGIAPAHLARQASIYLDWQEIEEMARTGITFGNHSGSHAVLSRLSEDDCREELARARRTLESVPGSIPSLAYPFGRSNEATRRVAIELGYTTLLDVEGLNNPVDPLRVGRLNVTSLSPAVLFARMELVAPIKWRLKQIFANGDRFFGRYPG
jgi:peptidoglycan/xylan/chitin deacetylase (PgdA/CDA1 family)